MWASLASLRVGHIALTNAWRVERNYFDTHLLDPNTYQPLLLQGLEQACHTFMPTVSVHKRLVPLLEEELGDTFGHWGEPTRKLVAHPGARLRLSRVLSDTAARGRVLVAVGPEGGWIERELELFDQVGFTSISIGESILRTDVACHVILGMVNELL
jgi:RsmE family RNA methyltransferase